MTFNGSRRTRLASQRDGDWMDALVGFLLDLRYRTDTPMLKDELAAAVKQIDKAADRQTATCQYIDDYRPKPRRRR